MNDFYKTCAYPKPQSKKKRKKQNGWKEKPGRRCLYTGLPNAERHEIFYGNGTRQISVDHGLQVDLHPMIHQLFHGIVDEDGLRQLHIRDMFPDPKGWAEKEQDRLRRQTQEKFELRDCIELGISPADARRRWIQMIGRSYL